MAKPKQKRELALNFRIKRDKKENKDVYIEGFANRAFIDGQKVIDRGNEHIAEEEWRIEEWLQNPQILYNHDRNLPVGVGVDAKVTEDGLWIKAKLSNSDVPAIKMVRDLVEERILKTFSVGIDIEKEEQAEDGSISLKGVHLRETSIVTIPMNQESFFDLSTKDLKEGNLDMVKAKIDKKKGAWVAAAIHERIYNLQSEAEDFDRAVALATIAEQAGVSQGELMELLAGNTVTFPEEVLQAASGVLGIDMAQLEELNEGDRQVVAGDETLNPEEAIEEEEEATEEAQEEPVEEESEEDLEMPLEDDEEDKETEEKPEEEEEGKQAVQEDDGEIEEPHKNPKVGEVEDSEDIEEEIENRTPKTGSERKELNDKVISYLELGMDQDEALSKAISESIKEGVKLNLTPADYTGILDTITNWKNEKQKNNGDDSNGQTGPFADPKPEDHNLGQPHIIALQQSNVMLGQMIAEQQKTNELLQKLLGEQTIEEAIPEENEEDQELSNDMEESEEEEKTSEEDEELEEGEDTEEEKAILEYQTKIAKSLDNMGV